MTHPESNPNESARLARLTETIRVVAARLREDGFPNEQAVSQGIVLRVLNDLGWDTYDPRTVWPEYQTGEGRVDFALCQPASKPAVFIEVKQPGGAEQAVRQAMEYSFHSGVPFMVLTDGKTWHFYLPGEKGSYEERRVYMLDLFLRSPADACIALDRFLSCSRTRNGDALEHAREQYRNQSRRTEARNAIPGAWRGLVEKGDELLVEVLASAVESMTGIRPDDDDVANFLLGLSVPTAATWTQEAKSRTKPMEKLKHPDLGTSSTFSILGTGFKYKNAKDVMVTVLCQLAKGDSGFLERCAQHPNARGKKRRYIARSTDELYPHREDLREYHAKLTDGWLVATNLNNILKRTIIRLACEVKGLKLGVDVLIPF